MLYIKINADNIQELHEDSEVLLSTGEVELTPEQMLALQLGTMTFTNGVVA